MFFTTAAALALAGSAQAVKTAEVDGWVIEKGSNYCSTGRSYPQDKLYFGVVQTQSGQIQLTFIDDDWKFADADRRDYAFRIQGPGSDWRWDGRSGSEWTSGGAGFVRIGIAPANVASFRQNLAGGGKFTLTRAGRQIVDIALPAMERVLGALAQCVATIG